MNIHPHKKNPPKRHRLPARPSPRPPRLPRLLPPVPPLPPVAAFLLLLALSPSAAAAQFRIGGYGSYQSDLFDGSFGVGTRAEVDLDFVFRGLGVAGTYDHFFPDCDRCKSFEAGGEVIASQGPFFIGAGAVLRHFESGLETEAEEDADDWVFSLVTGFRFVRFPVFTPFVQVRQELASETLNRRTFSAGVLVGPSRRRPAPARGAPLGR